MSTKPDSLVALDVTGDDYATTAAHDQHSGADATVAAVEAEDTEDEREKAGAARAARMRYTDQDFEAQKASYTARIDQGGIWKQLLAFDPPFQPSEPFFTAAVNATSVKLTTTTSTSPQKEGAKKKLDKIHHQTIVAAVSELYFLQKYPAVQQVITWAKEHFEKDKKWDQQLLKWEGKVKDKMDFQENV